MKGVRSAGWYAISAGSGNGRVAEAITAVGFWGGPARWEMEAQDKGKQGLYLVPSNPGGKADSLPKS